MNDSSHITNHRSPITDYPRISIIILNWNGWKDTIECLESLYQITYPNYNVIVVDNGSEDESIEKIEEYCEGKIKVESKFFEYSNENKPIKIIEYIREAAEAGGGKEKEIDNLLSNRKLILIKNEKNYGFAEGNNIAMRYALKALNPDYVLLLNNDTVVDPDFLTWLINLLVKGAQVGIAGPTGYYYNNPDTIWFTGLRINWWTGGIKDIIREGKQNIVQQLGAMEVDSVSGCAMLIGKEVLERISLLDTRFPFGKEDYEFCTRARRASFKVIYVPHSKIWHKIGKSRKKLMSSSTERDALLGRVGDLWLKTHFRFFKICSPSQAHYISQGVFFFLYLPLEALFYLRKRGFKATLVRIKAILKEIEYFMR